MFQDVIKKLVFCYKNGDISLHLIFFRVDVGQGGKYLDMVISNPMHAKKIATFIIASLFLDVCNLDGIECSCNVPQCLCCLYLSYISGI